MSAGLERDTQVLLEHWGLWVTQGAGVAGSQAPTERPTPMITDDDALVIDRLIGRLGHRYPECGEVVMRYYTSGDNFQQVGKRMKFGEEKTRQLWKAGVAWVDGALENRRVAVA